MQVDCWGVGVVTHILLGGFAPFASSRMEKLFRLIKNGRVTFQDVSEIFRTGSTSLEDLQYMTLVFLLSYTNPSRTDLPEDFSPLW